MSFFQSDQLVARLSNPNPYVHVRLWDMSPACQGIRAVAVLACLAWVAGALPGCGHFAAVGRGGAVYAISVESVNGRKTASRGPTGYPACAIQVGDRVAQVWLADESHGDVMSPAVLEGDAAALKDGILVERSWSQAVVHRVTDDELAAGAAVVYVPGIPRPTVVELRFERIRLGRRPRLGPMGAESARRVGLNTNRQ